ncbi:hypothetical protein B0H19DRAFT_1065548 [Mycena capillaripes]|nr:hypothetical protein B0H19DRAFT_1065548 [Mycena capillaripes]
MSLRCYLVLANGLQIFKSAVKPWVGRGDRSRRDPPTCGMFRTLFSTSILAILVGVLSAPQTSAIHLPSTCPSGQLCCPVGLMTPAERNEVKNFLNEWISNEAHREKKVLSLLQKLYPPIKFPPILAVFPCRSQGPTAGVMSSVRRSLFKMFAS